MAARKKTGFDKYFETRMKDSRFAAEYRNARAEIDATDVLIRALDQAREASGLSKAELARRIDAKPAMVRRLLTAPRGNPTVGTVLKVASALGYHLELAPGSSRRRRREAPRVAVGRRITR